MSIREGTFYGIWPVLDGKPLNLQWGEVRSNTAETKAIVRNSVQELETGVDELNALRALLGQAYGDLSFRNKYRFFYDSATQEMCCQKNDGTVDTPVWTDAWCVRFHDGQFQAVGQGGIQSNAGFYGPGLQTIEEVAESGSLADSSVLNPSKIFFRASDGLEVEKITSGANKGQPEIRFTQPFGRATQFFRSGSVWQVSHLFGVTPVLAQVMDSDDRIVIPDTADVSDPNTAWFYFNDTFTGSVYIASGGAGAAALVPLDPFYLVVRTDEQPTDGHVLDPNAHLIFDSRDFYVNVDLDDAHGGATPTAFLSLTDNAHSGVTFTDGTNEYIAAQLLNVNEDRFYLSSDKSGKPVLNSQFRDTTDFGAHVRMDDSLNVENTVTAEAFYLAPGSGGEISKRGNDLLIKSRDGQVVIDDELLVENQVVAEAFYVKNGNELTSLRFRESDGSPSIQNVQDVIVPSNTLTDNGDGTVTLTAVAGALDIKDENNVYLAPNVLTFANAFFYLTNDSSGDPVANLQPDVAGSGALDIKDENNTYTAPNALTFANDYFYLTNDSVGDPVCNLHSGSLFPPSIFTDVGTGANQTVTGSELDIADMIGFEFPSTPDGHKTFQIEAIIPFNMIAFSVGGGEATVIVTIRLYLGPNGDKDDTVVGGHQRYAQVNLGGQTINSRGEVVFNRRLTPSAGDKFGFSVIDDGAVGAGGNSTSFLLIKSSSSAGIRPFVTVTQTSE